MPDTLRPFTPWTTRAQADAAASLAREFKALGINLADCRACQGRWFAVSCSAEAFHRFVAPRFVSTLVAAAAAFAIIAVLA